MMAGRQFAMLASIAAATPSLAQDAVNNAPALTGIARVIDGDTIAIGKTRIRLEGVDVPETGQICLDAAGERWSCGIEARDRLAEHIKGRGLNCNGRGKDRYDRTLAFCLAGSEDVNEWIVREGWGLAYVEYSSVYVAEMRAARNERKGLWSGAFIAPWEWRHRDKQTVILGALSVPTTAQSILLSPASAANAPSPECIIKGNINRHNGERIYHMPGSLNYASINMADPAKRWFCSAEEAVAAGWRRAKNDRSKGLNP
jgi:endonuclease YncB( thermonuclease family)